MAETKKEVVESTTQQEQPKIDDKVEKIKIKPKTKKFSQGEEIYKVDLSKTPEVKGDNTKENTEQETANVVSDEQTPVVEEVVEEAPQQQDATQSETAPVIEEVTEEDKKEVEEVKEEIVKAVEEAEATGKPLPEDIEKLMTFMEETGGDLEDYVKLNRDVSKLDAQDVLYEYYQQTKPHLHAE